MSDPISVYFSVKTVHDPNKYSEIEQKRVNKLVCYLAYCCGRVDNPDDPLVFFYTLPPENDEA